MKTFELPEPAADAAVASAQLVALIKTRIADRGGWIGFDEMMQMALYQPALGYYSGGARKFGQAGDFTTAPQITPLFGQALATQCLQWFETIPPRILEFGAGSGELAVQLLGELSRAGQQRIEYLIVEISGELRERQRQVIASLGPEVAARVSWLEHWPDAIEGVVIGNELLDAMPVRLFRVASGELFERGVRVHPDGQLGFEDRLADADFAQQIRQTLERVWGGPENWPHEYVSEFGQQAQAWIEALAQRLVRGAVLLIDYGFPQAEFYHPQRATGTLMCHYRHFAHGDPFLHPGLQDITAHVDFSAIAAAAGREGLDCVGYLSQARLLMNLGMLELLARIPVGDSSQYLPAAQAAKRLLSEAEMGELFKAIAFGRGIPDNAIGFARGDRRAVL